MAAFEVTNEKLEELYRNSRVYQYQHSVFAYAIPRRCHALKPSDPWASSHKPQPWYEYKIKDELMESEQRRFEEETEPGIKRAIEYGLQRLEQTMSGESFNGFVVGTVEELSRYEEIASYLIESVRESTKHRTGSEELTDLHATALICVDSVVEALRHKNKEPQDPVSLGPETMTASQLGHGFNIAWKSCPDVFSLAGKVQDRKTEDERCPDAAKHYLLSMLQHGYSAALKHEGEIKIFKHSEMSQDALVDEDLWKLPSDWITHLLDGDTAKYKL